MAAQDLMSQMPFKIGGNMPAAAVLGAVKEIVVDTSIYLPDMFSIQFDDTNLSLVDSADLDIGKLIEISGKGEGERSATQLTAGEVVAVEPEFTQDTGTTIAIRGYDKSHRLHRGKKTRVFQNMTDSDIINNIARDHGLAVQLDSTSVVHEHVFQDHQTDMEFVLDRAHRAGYFACVENGTLHFRRPGSQTSAARLNWGENLTDFRARLTSAEQVTRSEVHGWDIAQKRAISGSKDTPQSTPTVNSQSHGGQMASNAFGVTAEEFISNMPVATQAEADMIAQSALNDRCQAFFHAEGTCLGNPAIRAGKTVEIGGIGDRFSGRYLVTRAVHRYDISGYTTQFEISGYRAATLRQLLRGEEKSEKAYGVVVGIVTNVDDPDGLARVKVKYPTITDDLESNWARLVSPMAGSGRGIEFIPEVNDEVLVAFEYNDINRPYVMGSLWNGQDTPPEANSSIVSNGEVQKRIIKSRSGHIITLDDTQSSEKITIVDKAGQTFVLDSSSGAEKVEIVDRTGSSKITMDAAQRSVTIESAMDMTLRATGKVEISGQTGVAISSAGGNLDLESNAQTNIKGMQATLEGTGTAEVKSSGMLTVQGSMVKIN